MQRGWQAHWLVGLVRAPLPAREHARVQRTGGEVHRVGLALAARQADVVLAPGGRHMRLGGQGAGRRALLVAGGQRPGEQVLAPGGERHALGGAVEVVPGAGLRRQLHQRAHAVRLVALRLLQHLRVQGDEVRSSHAKASESCWS